MLDGCIPKFLIKIYQQAVLLANVRQEAKDGFTLDIIILFRLGYFIKLGFGDIVAVI